MKNISGFFVKYNGKKYEASYNFTDKKVNIISHDFNDKNNGFIEKRTNGNSYLIKNADLSEIEDAYSLHTLAIYKHQEVGVSRKQNENEYVIFHGNNDFCNRNGFKWVERGVWEKVVEESELDKIWQVKSPILGF